MDRWNRVAISLVALLVLVGAVVTVLVATEAVDPDFLPGGSEETTSEAWFYDQLKGVADFSGSDQAVAIVVTIVVGLAMVPLLWLQARPILRKRQSLPVSTTERGAFTVEADSVKLLAEKVGASNRNVSSLKCRLRVRRRTPAGGPASIVIECCPRVVLGSNVPEIRDDLQTRIKESVEQLTGLTVLRVNVMRIKYDRGDSTRLVGA